MKQTKQRGRHRRPAQRAALVGAGTIALAISYSGVAVAAPQPGVTDVQPEPDMPKATQPGLAEEIAPESESESKKTESTKVKQYWVAPPVEYANVPTREIPTYDEVAPVVTPEQLHLPTQVEIVAPIEAPEDKLRLGDYVSEKPQWLSEQDLERTNNSSAVVEAQVATFWKSIGIETSRSDRIAAATTAGVVTGFVTGAAVAGIPAALIGGTIGGTSALFLVPAYAWSGPFAFAIAPAMVAGGAAIAGVPAALVGGTIGAVIGGVAGANYGAGDTTIAPTVEHDQAAPVAPAAPPVEAAPPAPAPQLPAVNPITAATQQVVAQIETLPGGAAAVSELRVFAAAAPQLADDASVVVDDQVRAAAAETPGGTDAVAAFDGAAPMLDPAADQVHNAALAVQAGVLA